MRFRGSRLLAGWAAVTSIGSQCVSRQTTLRPETFSLSDHAGSWPRCRVQHWNLAAAVVPFSHSRAASAAALEKNEQRNKPGRANWREYGIADPRVRLRDDGRPQAVIVRAFPYSSEIMTEPLDPRSRSIGLRRSHRLEGKLLGVRYAFAVETFELNPTRESSVMKEIAAAPDPTTMVQDSAPAERSAPQAIGNWESEGGATPH